MLPSIVLGLQSSGLAQTNLVNLYDWNISSDTGSPDVRITSFNSASFLGDGATNGGPTSVSTLSGVLNTIPGATYEISFTMVNEVEQYGGGSETFGNTGTSFLLTSTETNVPPNYIPNPVNIDYTAVATSTTTTMTFEASVDGEDGWTELFDASVVEVPETSGVGLLGFGGCFLLFANQWRRLLQKQKPRGNSCVPTHGKILETVLG